MADPIDSLKSLDADVRLLDNLAAIAAVPRETHVRAQEAARRLLEDLAQRAAAEKTEKK